MSVTTKTQPLARLREAISRGRKQLENHPLYEEIRDIHHLRLFLQSHVFAVWDFMSLLKSLQASLTCVTTPWVPSNFPKSRRLINEIVLGEESDSFGDGFLSHFEIYMQAMREAGADPFTIRAFLAELKNGVSIDEALLLAQPPAEALEFVRTTFRFLNADKPHVTAAAFTFGREDLIPDMFRGMVKELGRSTEGVGLFEYYLDRHVEVDGDSHGPMALQMLNELCGEDEKKWDEAIAAAQEAIAARVAFWDGILLRIQSSEF